MNPKKPQWTDFGAAAAAGTVKDTSAVYLRAGDAWVRVRTYAAEGKIAFVGNVEGITAPPPAGVDLQEGDWVRFEPRHVFSVCISHE